MKKNALIDALSYENFILKTKYNEMVQYSTKLQEELKTVKEIDITLPAYTTDSCHYFKIQENETES